MSERGGVVCDPAQGPATLGIGGTAPINGMECGPIETEDLFGAATCFFYQSNAPDEEDILDRLAPLVNTQKNNQVR